MAPKTVIIEYLGTKPDERIYGIGMLAEDGELLQPEDETFGSLPGGGYDVMKADGALVSYEDYCAEIQGPGEA